MECLQNLAKVFEANGKTLFVVGGHVRDFLLGKFSEDIDLASSCTPEEVAKILDGTEFEIVKTLAQVGVVQINADGKIFDHATFRRDFYRGDGSHFPMRVEFVKKMKIDAKRRDFTINAIYKNLLTKHEFYHFGGKKHIKNHVLATCIDAKKSFAEDALRILRLVRFALQLNFTIEKKTFEAAKAQKHLLKNVSKNVIENELKKMPIGFKESALWKELELKF